MVTSKGRYTNSKGKRTNHARKSTEPVEFVGVDGEGITVNVVDSQGVCVREHRYVLFGVGDRQIENVRGLQWWEIFRFLYAAYRPRVAYVGFFLGYDFTQIFKSLPEDRARMLLTSEGRAVRKHTIKGKLPHPVEARGHDGQVWHFDILGNKRLRLRPKRCQCEVVTCKCQHASWMYICDAGGYFQSSFLKAIDPEKWNEVDRVVSDEEYRDIRLGKERRSTAVLDNAMRKYNALENEILARVMAVLDRGLHAIGIHLSASKWFGPGQAAQQWLKNAGVPTGQQIREAAPPWFLEAARMSYFGGWFEIFMHGYIPGESHEYDINSAYPYHIARLPCLLHGTYSSGDGTPPAQGERTLTLVYARVWAKGMPSAPSSSIGTMLHRDRNGNIIRPYATEGWYWWDELRTAERAGLVKRLDNRGKQQVLKWVSYEPCDCPPPMAGVADLYQRRLNVGKKTPLGRVAKLVYNSMYGKFAQSVGEPIFGNAIYASRITSGCRTQILDAIATHPKGASDVCMVATDGVYFLSPHPGLSKSTNLGEWDYATRFGLTLFKPGMYWDDDTRRKIATGESVNFKARGIKASDFASSIRRIDRDFASWEHADSHIGTGTVNREWPTVSFRASFAMISALQALRRNDWSLAGHTSSGVELVQDSDPYTKRRGVYLDTADADRPVWRSRPHYGLTEDPDTGLVWVASTPYVKRFGMEDPFSDEYKEQYGITPDGPVMDTLMWVLTGKG